MQSHSVRWIDSLCALIAPSADLPFRSWNEANQTTGSSPSQELVGLCDRGVAVDELPAGEVDVAEQVVAPGRLHRRLVGEDQHPLPAHHEIDRLDLEQAAAALAEREQTKQLSGADILRHSIGLGRARAPRWRRRAWPQLGY